MTIAFARKAPFTSMSPLDSCQLVQTARTRPRIGHGHLSLRLSLEIARTTIIALGCNAISTKSLPHTSLRVVLQELSFIPLAYFGGQLSY